MGSEKVLAMLESMNAMGLQVAKAQQEYALFALRNWSLPWMTPWSMAVSASKVLEKGLGPLHKRASANARRLRTTASAAATSRKPRFRRGKRRSASTG